MPLPALAMLGVQAGLGAGQAYLAGRSQKAAERRQREQAAQDKLLQSFSPGAQPTPMPGAQGPGVGQQMLADPLTQQLLAALISKGIGGLGGGGGGVAGLQNPAQLSQPAAPTYSPDIRSFAPRFQ
jgi:hypothetical protein